MIRLYDSSIGAFGCDRVSKYGHYNFHIKHDIPYLLDFSNNRITKNRISKSILNTWI